MNIVEYVKLSSDTNYIPVKYAVMSASVGSSLGASNAWLKCVGYGIDTKEHFDEFKDKAENESKVVTTNLLGTPGTYSVQALDDVVPYSTPATFQVGAYNLG